MVGFGMLTEWKTRTKVGLSDPTVPSGRALFNRKQEKEQRERERSVLTHLKVPRVNSRRKKGLFRTKL